MRTLYLHIGIGKTGTTSLQHFLADNRDSLKKAGFLYPLAGTVNNAHHELCCLDNKVDWHRLEKTYIDLLSEISKTKEAVIISSEYFSYANPHIIKFLKHIFEGFSLRVIFYARPQLGLIESSYLQWHKVRNEKLYGEPIFTFYEKCLLAFDFNVVIRPWEKEFGQKSIQTSLYHQDSIGLDICNHFLSLIGITDPKILNRFTFPTENANQSLHPFFLETLMSVDKMGIFPDREAFVEDLVRASQKIQHIKYSFFTSEQKNQIRESYKKSNGIFADKYLNSQEKELLLEM